MPHLTRLTVRPDGRHAVWYGGRTWSLPELQARRLLCPGRFDAHHTRLGLILDWLPAIRARRDLGPARFDHYHPYLGWLLQDTRALPPPAPTLPVPGTLPPGGEHVPGMQPPPIPPAAVPTPTSVALTAVGLLFLVCWIVLRPRRRDPRESQPRPPYGDH